MKNLDLKSLIKYLMITIIFSVQDIVYAGDIGVKTSWILLGESPSLDRSSLFMSNGFTKSGIKYAKKALRFKQSEAARMLAHHNLCIAYLTQGKTELAVKHCPLAQNILMSDAYLKELRPGLYKVTRARGTKPGITTISATITNNLKINGLSENEQWLVQTGN